MYTMGVIFALLVAVNLAVFWIWIVKRIADRGYGRSARADRVAKMMPVTDRTVVVERRNGPDLVRVVEGQSGATAGSTA